MFGEGLHGGFRGIVGWVSRRVGNALLGAGDDYTGGMRGGGGLGNEG